jgi:predicted nucleic acid-binding protein
MLIVDASSLYEVVADTARADAVRARLALDPDHGAPSVVDVEVVSIIRRDHLAGALDATAAAQAVEDLRDWPGERYAHRPLLDRVWELRQSVRDAGCRAYLTTAWICSTGKAVIRPLVWSVRRSPLSPPNDHSAVQCCVTTMS